MRINIFLVCVLALMYTSTSAQIVGLSSKSEVLNTSKFFIIDKRIDQQRRNIAEYAAIIKTDPNWTVEEYLNEYEGVVEIVAKRDDDWLHLDAMEEGFLGNSQINSPNIELRGAIGMRLYVGMPAAKLRRYLPKGYDHRETTSYDPKLSGISFPEGRHGSDQVSSGGGFGLLINENTQKVVRISTRLY